MARVAEKNEEIYKFERMLDKLSSKILYPVRENVCARKVFIY